MPNIDYTELFKLTEPERKGLMYGSLISAILGAGVGVLSGESAGESIARGLHAGATAYSQGYQNLEDYKKLIYSALRQQEADRLAQEEWNLKKQKWEAELQNLATQRKQIEELTELPEAIVGWTQGIHIPSRFIGVPATPKNLLGKPIIPTLGEGIGFSTPEINIPSKPITLAEQVATETGIPTLLVKQLIKSGEFTPLIKSYLEKSKPSSPLKISPEREIMLHPETRKWHIAYVDKNTGNVINWVREATPAEVNKMVKGTEDTKGNSPLNKPLPKGIREYVKRIYGIDLPEGMSYLEFDKVFGNIRPKNVEEEVFKGAWDMLKNDYRFAAADLPTREKMLKEAMEMYRRYLTGGNVENTSQQPQIPQKSDQTLQRPVKKPTKPLSAFMR